MARDISHVSESLYVGGGGGERGSGERGSGERGSGERSGGVVGVSRAPI